MGGMELSERTEELLTVQEAAKRLNVSPRTVQRWVKSGRLSASERPHPGGIQWLIPESEVRRYDTDSLYEEVLRLRQENQQLKAQCDNVVTLKAETKPSSSHRQEIDSLKNEIARLNHQLDRMSRDYGMISAELAFWKIRCSPENPDELHEKAIKQIHDVYSDGVMVGVSIYCRVNRLLVDKLNPRPKLDPNTRMVVHWIRFRDSAGPVTQWMPPSVFDREYFYYPEKYKPV
jgi:excisionase family DNA binding protein